MVIYSGRFVGLGWIKKKEKVKNALLQMLVSGFWWIQHHFYFSPSIPPGQTQRNSLHWVKESLELSVSIHWGGNNDIRERRAGERKSKEGRGRAEGGKSSIPAGSLGTNGKTFIENSLLAPLSTDPLRMWTHRHSSTDIWHQGRMSVDEIIKASLTCRLLFGQSSLTPKKQLTFSSAAGPTKK